MPEAGRSWDDPSEDLLFILLEDIEAGQGSFLIIERTNDPSGQTHAQARRRDDGSYVVERREATPTTTTARSSPTCARPPTARRMGMSSDGHMVRVCIQILASSSSTAVR